jgi:hypothetical protein
VIGIKNCSSDRYSYAEGKFRNEDYKYDIGELVSEKEIVVYATSVFR